MIQSTKQLTATEKETLYSLWQRNVVDKYKPLSTEDIKKDLRKNAIPAAVLMAQVEGDFNFSNVVRTANFFNLQCVYYYGRKHYDRRGTCGSYIYSDVRYLRSIDDVKKLKEHYTFVGLENNINKPTYNINSYKFKPNSVLILGEEGFGIASEIIDLCDDLVEIVNFGSVRSLNAATAAAIAINTLSDQFRK